jgi:Barstar (barnase inhibitor)
MCSRRRFAPDYYGRNGNAFIDCLRDILDGRDASRILQQGESLTIDLGDLGDFRQRCPEQLAALLDWTSWANGEQIDNGNQARVSLAFR